MHGQRAPGRGEGGGLARAVRALDHHQRRRTGQRCDRGRLPGLEWLTVGRERAVGLGRLAGFSAARGQPGDEVGFDVKHVPGAEHADVLWRWLLVQRKAEVKGAGGEVFGQLDPHRLVGDDPGPGEQLLGRARRRRSTPTAQHPTE
jgi:hypothetical protein